MFQTTTPSAPRLPVALALSLLALTGGTGGLRGDVIEVPNGSFETPATTYVANQIDAWQKTPKPFWFDEGTMGLWDQLTGVFLNPPPGDPYHIDNCDGNQALYVFAVPQAGLFQDYEAVDWSGATHGFDARFEVGRAYQLIVGVIGGGRGSMTPGATLLLGLYYRDAAGQLVTVAATNVVYTPAVFPGMTHFVDCQVLLPVVQPGDPWAGQRLGVQLLSTVSLEIAGGYWDIDHVRLRAILPPTLTAPGWTNGQFGFTLRSEPGLSFEMLATTNLGEAFPDWLSVGNVTNLTGETVFTDASAGPQRRFYQARLLP
jgi:hypothetical protein